MNRRSEQDTICCFHLLDPCIKTVTLDNTTLIFVSGAVATAQTALYLFISHLDYFCLYILVIKLIRNHAQSLIGITLFSRTSVKSNHFHQKSLSNQIVYLYRHFLFIIQQKTLKRKGFHKVFVLSKFVLPR